MEKNNSRNKSLAKVDSYKFNYVYTCDIEDALFRVKIGNIDGISPPALAKSHHESRTPSSANYSSATVENHYNYNIVEVLDELSLVDELISSDEENETAEASEAVRSGKSRCSFLHPSSSSTVQSKSKQSKNKKLSQIVFGSLNQPFRALSAHPYITCDLISNQQRICPPQQTQYKQMFHRYDWNEWLVYALTIDTLPRDSRICFTIWDTIGPGKTVAVARTSISLFSKHGCMRKGIYDLRLYFNEDCEEYYNPLSVESHPKSDCHKSDLTNTEINANDIDLNNREHRNKDLLIVDKVALLNKNKDFETNPTLSTSQAHRNLTKNFNYNSLMFTSTTQYLQSNLTYYPDGNSHLSQKIKQLNKLKKKYYTGQMAKLDWLDRLTFLKIEKIMVHEKSLSTVVFLTVEFPSIILNGIEHSAVYFEDKDEQCCQYDIIEKDIVKIQDPELSLVNLVEAKHHCLARSARSGISYRDMIPNSTSRTQLNQIMNYPSTRHLTSEEQDLVWKFRFYLRNQKKALTKFLKTVNWTLVSEVDQAISLMKEWIPMDIEDALELLSPYFTHPAVRRYAVSRLKEATNEDLLLYLLQLVQALKYENFNDIQQSFEFELKKYEQQKNALMETSTRFDSTLSRAEGFLTESIRIFSSSHGEDHSRRKQSTEPPAPAVEAEEQSSFEDGDDLATFLLERASSNDALANYFFWYLMVECEGAKSFTANSSIDKSNTALYSSVISSAITNSSFLLADTSGQPDGITNVADMYLIMLRRFCTRLQMGTPEMKARREILNRQKEFVVCLVEITKDVARESGNRLKKIEKLQSILSTHDSSQLFNFSPSDPLPLPLDPNVKIVGILTKEATLFKSTTMPAKLAFRTTDGSIYYTIFKYGDDLRQDDLVLQMIILMDKLLRMENLDLKLTPYRVLACSSKHGFVQFIDSQSVGEVVDSDNSIQNYLRKVSSQPTISVATADYGQSITSASLSVLDFQLVSSAQPRQSQSQQNSDPHSTSGPSSTALAGSISPEVLDAYIKSCAGYCVITYLLGVGDRHLDNLMLTKTGRLFHIDFGFILGRDPKVRPPPMKITREMVEAMGGMNSDNFSRFCSLVRTAFLHLRRHANLILNLFSLMVDANVPDIALEPDKTVQKVKDKFKLELNDEQADHYITEQVDQSVRSIVPVVVDQLHKMTQYLRN